MASPLAPWFGRSDNERAPFHSLHREIDRVFEDFNRNFGLPAMRGAGDAASGLLSPSTDVVETDATVEITAELPGVNEDDIDVTIADNVLTIRGEKKAESREEKDNVHVVERSYGSYQRSWRLPSDVDADKIDAQFKDGVLKVVVPKPPEAETKTRKIAVKPAG